MFKKGSYWIYRNDMTGVEDSSYLYSTPTIEPTPYSETGPIAHYLNSYFGGKFIYSVHAGFDWHFSEFRLYHQFIFHEGSESIISGHIKKGYSEINEESNFNYRVIGIDDTLNIDNTIYNNILTTQFTRFGYQSSDTIKYTYFFDKIHGLIRFVKTSGAADTTWSLMRSHVLK